MCGRFAVSDTTADLLPELLGDIHLPDVHADPDTGEVHTGLPARYNVAPATDVSAVRARKGARTIEPVHWGFVPSWATDFARHRPQPINARIETVATNRMFAGAFAARRCLIPASGYYEWVTRPDGKEPHYICNPGGALTMAGIMSAWADPQQPDESPDRWRLSLAIITMDAHIAPGEVHDRMPALVTPDGYDTWLDECSRPDDLIALLHNDSTRAAATLEQYEVARAVSNARNEGAHLIDPVE